MVSERYVIRQYYQTFDPRFITLLGRAVTTDISVQPVHVNADDIAPIAPNSYINPYSSPRNAHLKYFAMSSSPKRPSSMASTELTTQPPSSEKINSTIPHPPDAASDPFLVSFTPDDPDNPLVRIQSYFSPLQSNFLPSLAELVQKETMVDHPRRGHLGFKCVRLTCLIEMHSHLPNLS
jgi:hypothetical protein